MKRENRAHKAVVILLLVVIFLLAGLSCWMALRLFRTEETSPAGVWRTELDLTETARTAANAWLREAELGEQIDAGDALPPIRVAVFLTLSEDGSWTRRVDGESYRQAQDAASAALASSLRALLGLRIVDAGRAEESDEQLDARIYDAIGMTSAEYVAAYAPALLPELEELQAAHDGGGSWKTEGAQFKLDGQTKLYALLDEGLLVQVGSDTTEVYAHVGE